MNKKDHKTSLTKEEMLDLAFKVAKKAHMGQVDKSGKDYIAHPIKVASLVETKTLKTIALLHDVVEDSDVTLSDLYDYGFNKKIVDAVDAVTKRDGEKYADYISRVKRNKRAIAVKIADAVHNGDVTRISNPSDIDIRRSKKYNELTEQLLALLDKKIN